MPASNRAPRQSRCSSLLIEQLKKEDKCTRSRVGLRGRTGRTVVHVSYKILRIRKRWLGVVALLALGQFAPASNTPLVSGSYEVVQNTDLGSQAQIRMRIHLVNHGPTNLSIQRMTLWDFSHPDRGGTHASAVTLQAHASAETTQEFTIRRSEYELWRRGLRPRLVLEMTAPGNTKSTAVVRLDRISGQEAK